MVYVFPISVYTYNVLLLSPPTLSLSLSLFLSLSLSLSLPLPPLTCELYAASYAVSIRPLIFIALFCHNV